ncbi:MAG: hypothetical protein JSS14_22150 [Proteobacteria bacterium]|nr:hypothetical protein [Pseudomonadota bacterium]
MSKDDYPDADSSPVDPPPHAGFNTYVFPDEAIHFRGLSCGISEFPFVDGFFLTELIVTGTIKDNCTRVLSGPFETFGAAAAAQRLFGTQI